MLRPGDDCYVIDSKDPTPAIAAAVDRLRAAGVTKFVYGRGGARSVFLTHNCITIDRRRYFDPVRIV